MSFHDVRFPTAISRGATGGPTWSTAVIQTDSGAEQRLSRWDAPRRRYDAAYGIRAAADVYAVLQFFLARQGRLYGFRWKDWQDFTTAPDGVAAPVNTDQQIGVGDGARTQFALVKTYASGPVQHVRTLTRPVAGTVVVAIDGVDQASGWTVDAATGTVTFDAAPAADAVVTAGCEFDVPVRFDDDHLDVTLQTATLHAVPSVPVIEVLDEAELDLGFFAGGATHVDLATESSIDPTRGRVQTLQSSAGGTQAYLPSPDAYPPGGPICYLCSDSSNVAEVTVYYDGTLLAILAPGCGTTLCVGAGGAGGKVWRCL